MCASFFQNKSYSFSFKGKSCWTNSKKMFLRLSLPLEIGIKSEKKYLWFCGVVISYKLDTVQICSQVSFGDHQNSPFNFAQKHGLGLSKFLILSSKSLLTTTCFNPTFFQSIPCLATVKTNLFCWNWLDPIQKLNDRLLQ